jgi:hypothetical protein
MPLDDVRLFVVDERHLLGAELTKTRPADKPTASCASILFPAPDRGIELTFLRQGSHS